jgi:hypothetical protein
MQKENKPAQKIQNVRLTGYLEELWEEKRGEKHFPSLESMIQILEEDKSIVDSIFILEASIKVGRHSFSMKHIGENITELYKDPSEDKTQARLINNFLEANKRNLERVVSTKAKVINNIEIHLGEEQNLKYRQILLPLGDATTETVTAILGGMRCKKMGNEEQYLVR